MKIFNTFFILAVLGLSLISCNQKVKERVPEEIEENTIEESYTPSPYLGNYVTASYFERESGADWVAVAVKELDADILLILVNSRDDIKKPTCTFESIAEKVNDSIYKAIVEDKAILFTFDKNTVTISSEKPEDADFLRYFCNGGASLAGIYTKTEN